MSVSRCTKLVETYPHRLKVDAAAKGEGGEYSRDSSAAALLYTTHLYTQQTAISLRITNNN